MVDERAFWREPVLVGAVVVLIVALAVFGTFGYDALTDPVLQSPTDADGVPTELPNGQALPPVPQVLQGAFDRPVVLVGVVEEDLHNLERCGDLVEWAFAPTLRASLVTPEGLMVAVRGEELGSEATFQVACYALWTGRRWESWASWVAETANQSDPVSQPEPACCRPDDLALLGGEIQAPEGAAWAVQDRGPYWLAFPVDTSGLVHPVWPVVGGDPAPPTTVYVDEAGNRLEGSDADAEPEPDPEPDPEAQPAPDPDPEAQPAPDPEGT